MEQQKRTNSKEYNFNQTHCQSWYVYFFQRGPQLQLTLKSRYHGQIILEGKHAFVTYILVWYLSVCSCSCIYENHAPGEAHCSLEVHRNDIAEEEFSSAQYSCRWILYFLQIVACVPPVSLPTQPRSSSGLIYLLHFSLCYFPAQCIFQRSHPAEITRVSRKHLQIPQIALC